LENKMQIEIKVSVDTDNEEDRELVERIVQLAESLKNVDNQ